MVHKFTSIAFAGALMVAALPASAQDLGGAINGLTAVPGQLVGGVGSGLGIDLDPFHIFTPAPMPAMAPGPEPMMRRHRMMRRHMMMHHHGMMMHKKMMHKKMMHKKMMMKKPMMKKDDAGK